MDPKAFKRDLQEARHAWERFSELLGPRSSGSIFYQPMADLHQALSNLEKRVAQAEEDPEELLVQNLVDTVNRNRPLSTSGGGIRETNYIAGPWPPLLVRDVTLAALKVAVNRDAPSVSGPGSTA